MRLLSFVMIAFIALLPTQAQETQSTLEHDGRERLYYLHIPQDIAENPPLVIVLHGAGGSGVEMFVGTQFDQLANATGALVAYPEGVQQGWTYLDEDELHPADLYVDDIGFVAALIEEIRAEHAVSDVFVVGYSNGGLLALRALCDISDDLAGMAIVSATFGFELATHCTTPNPLPVLFTLGSADPTFPWGGAIRVNDAGLIRSRFSINQTRDFMLFYNQCDLASETDVINAPDSPVRVIRDAYTSCADDATFVLYGLMDYGHSYPFQPRVLLDDGSNGTVDALIWQFFESQRGD